MRVVLFAACLIFALAVAEAGDLKAVIRGRTAVSKDCTHDDMTSNCVGTCNKQGMQTNFPLFDSSDTEGKDGNWIHYHLALRRSDQPGTSPAERKANPQMFQFKNQKKGADTWYCFCPIKSLAEDDPVKGCYSSNGGSGCTPAPKLLKAAQDHAKQLVSKAKCGKD